MTDIEKFPKNRVLLKPTPLMPDEESIERNIIEQHNLDPMALLVDGDEDVRAAESEFEAARRKLEETKLRKAMMRLASADLDPDNVEELCEKEPWYKGKLTLLSISSFGFVPEKFEAAAKMKPEGSPERIRLIEARDRARVIYWDQIKADLRRITGPIEARRSNDARATRAAYEDQSMALWQFYKRANLENSPLYKNQGGRVMWLALAIGEAFMKAHQGGSSGPALARGPGYQQMRIPAILPPEMDDAPPLAPEPDAP